MLRTRIFAALPVFCFLFFSLQWDVSHGSTAGFTLFLLVTVFCSVRETLRMAERRGYAPFRHLALWGSLGLVLLQDRANHEAWNAAVRPWLAGLDLETLALTLVILLPLLRQLLRPTPEGAIGSIATTQMALLYAWFLPCFCGRIHHLSLGGGWQHDGPLLVFLTIFLNKLGDVGAYLIGCSFGKRLLCPQLSPKKTWEGFFGGVGLCLLASGLLAALMPHSAFGALGVPLALLFGLLMALSSLAGDLAESMLKRDSQMKDAGTSLPGFGGVLDLVDSLMVGGPVAFYFFLLCGAKAGG